MITLGRGRRRCVAPPARPPARLLPIGFALCAVLGAAAASQAGILDASWTAPTTNADGSRLTDLASYRVYHGTSSLPCPGLAFFTVAASTPSPPDNHSVDFELTGLAAGTLYHVAVAAVNTSNAESVCSNVASAVARLEFAVSPAGTVSFGDVDVGSAADRIFTVENTVGGTVAGTATVSAPFSVVAGSPFTLVGNGATGVTVRFTPTTPATATANVSFTGNGDTISRSVTGTGTGTDTVTISRVTFARVVSTLFVSATSSSSPDAALSVTVPGCLAETPMQWSDRAAAYVLLDGVKRCGNLDGQTVTVTSSYGGAATATIR